MINLQTYRNIPETDTHIHLFDKDGINTLYDGSRCIGFADVNDTDIDYWMLYHNYTNKHTVNGSLFATGRTPEEIIKIYNDFDCKGFGELKYRKESKKISYNQTAGWLREILSYNQSLNNDPVLIHCDFTENIIPIIEGYRNTPIIHCHCGCPDSEIFKEDIIKEEYLKSVSLSKKYSNYYYDLSWSVADFLYKHPEYLKYNNPSKLLIGSDLNQNLCDKEDGSLKAAHIREVYRGLREVYGACSDMNSLRIFR